MLVSFSGFNNYCRCLKTAENPGGEFTCPERGVVFIQCSKPGIVAKLRGFGKAISAHGKNTLVPEMPGIVSHF